METQEITRHIVEWLRAYSYRGFVVGVSGGVDSAVTSTLCAMTGRPTIAVYMPEVLNTKQSTLAEQHMAELALRYSNIESKTLEMYPLL